MKTLYMAQHPLIVKMLEIVKVGENVKDVAYRLYY